MKLDYIEHKYYRSRAVIVGKFPETRTVKDTYDLAEPPEVKLETTKVGQFWRQSTRKTVEVPLAIMLWYVYRFPTDYRERLIRRYK